MKILLTGGGGAGSIALKPLLQAQGHEVFTCDSDPCVNADYTIPPVLQNGLVNGPWLSQMWQFRDEFDLIIPGIDEELRPLAYRMPEKLLLPAFDTVAVHLDKLASMRRLDSLGIAVPKTARLRPALNSPSLSWPDGRDDAFVLKPREGRGSRDVFTCRDWDEGCCALTVARRSAADFITQELLIGQEYSVGVLADRNKHLKAVIPVRIDKKRGITLRAQIELDPEVIALGEAIHQADPFSGYINVQCIKEANGQVRPFEINPRVSTTTCLAVAAGLDLVGAFLGNDPYRPVRMPITSLRRYYHTEFT